MQGLQGLGRREALRGVALHKRGNKALGLVRDAAPDLGRVEGPRCGGAVSSESGREFSFENMFLDYSVLSTFQGCGLRQAEAVHDHRVPVEIAAHEACDLFLQSIRSRQSLRLRFFFSKTLCVCVRRGLTGVRLRIPAAERIARK